MKYNWKEKMLAFSSDEEVFRFHDQLTEAMRTLMLHSGGEKATSAEEDVRLTREFFERYSMLAESLRCLRAHMQRTAENQTG